MSFCCILNTTSSTSGSKRLPAMSRKKLQYKTEVGLPTTTKLYWRCPNGQ
ncbi:hypothetical protein [Clostridium sp. UBA5712]